MSVQLPALGLMLVIFAAPTQAQQSSQSSLVDTVAGLRLHSALLPNLHHLLHAEGVAFRNRIDTTTLEPSERRSWLASIAYYTTHLAPRDLRRGSGMPEIMDRLSVDSLSGVSGLEPAHANALATALPVYRKHRWSRDDSVNRSYIRSISGQLRSVQSSVIPKLNAFYGQSWYVPADSVRVDIVSIGGARGAYTWTRPRVHVVIDADERNYDGWRGVEMLLHEGSHGLTGLLEAKVSRAADAANKDVGQLWHAIQFYVVAELMRRTLAERGHEFLPYPTPPEFFGAPGPDTRGRWRRPSSRYLNGELTLERAVETTIEAIQ